MGSFGYFYLKLSRGDLKPLHMTFKPIMGLLDLMGKIRN